MKDLERDRYKAKIISIPPMISFNNSYYMESDL